MFNINKGINCVNHLIFCFSHKMKNFKCQYCSWSHLYLLPYFLFTMNLAWTRQGNWHEPGWMNYSMSFVEIVIEEVQQLLCLKKSSPSHLFLAKEEWGVCPSRVSSWLHSITVWYIWSLPPSIHFLFWLSVLSKWCGLFKKQKTKHTHTKLDHIRPRRSRRKIY